MPALGEQAHLPVSPERGMPCPQTWFDPILQEHARSFPHVTLRHRTKLESFVQDSDGVTATLRDEQSGRLETVRARYLVGCDGFASTVRELLGIEIRGEPHIDWSMTIYLRIPDLQAQHDKGKAFRYVFVGPEGTWSFLSIVDGKDLWRLQLVDLDEGRLQNADIPALMRRCMGRDVAYTIEDKNLWVRKRTVADRFMDGRVFLAGDAAHAHPPNGGLGMNTGIQDAFDLGWKLAAVLGGWGGETLLESYDIETASGVRPRRGGLAQELPAARQRCAAFRDQFADAGRRCRAPHDRRAAGRGEREDLASGRRASRLHLSSVADCGAGWNSQAGGRHLWLSTDGVSRRAGAARLACAPEKSILDLFGDGFVLLKFSDTPTDAIESAAASRGVPLAVHRIEHAGGGRTLRRALVLVRPDGHVAWRGDHEPLDALQIIDAVRGAGPRIAARRASV